MIHVNFTVTNDNPNTIHNVLKRRIGREPTSAEARRECLRIMRREDVAPGCDCVPVYVNGENVHDLMTCSMFDGLRMDGGRK